MKWQLYRYMTVRRKFLFLGIMIPFWSLQVTGVHCNYTVSLHKHFCNLPCCNQISQLTLRNEQNLRREIIFFSKIQEPASSNTIFLELYSPIIPSESQKRRTIPGSIGTRQSETWFVLHKYSYNDMAVAGTAGFENRLCIHSTKAASRGCSCM